MDTVLELKTTGLENVDPQNLTVSSFPKSVAVNDGAVSIFKRKSVARKEILRSGRTETVPPRIINPAKRPTMNHTTKVSKKFILSLLEFLSKIAQCVERAPQFYHFVTYLLIVSLTSID